MFVAIVAFDDFTDIDVFLPWDLLNRVAVADWSVNILADTDPVTSSAGLPIPVHGPLTETAGADAVLVASGKGSRAKIKDPDFLGALRFDPARQLIGAVDSGALILAALGLLDGIEATTYPSTVPELEAFGVTVVQRPFARSGNIATAAQCLGCQDLVAWIVAELAGPREAEAMLSAVQRIGDDSAVIIPR